MCSCGIPTDEQLADEPERVKSGWVVARYLTVLNADANLRERDALRALKDHGAP